MKDHMTGKFDFHNKGVSIVHFIPQGEFVGGHPVIVFPQNDREVQVGKVYSFYVQLTMDATYTTDNTVYRVAHAIAPQVQDKNAAGPTDCIFHRTSGRAASVTLGDSDAGKTLAALKAQMAAE